MIQTDTCEVCGGGVYREITSTWDNDQWRHMDPEFIQYPHRPIVRSNQNDDTADGPTRR